MSNGEGLRGFDDIADDDESEDILEKHSSTIMVFLGEFCLLVG